MKTRLSYAGIVVVMMLCSCDHKKGLPIVPAVAGLCDSIKYSVDIQPILTANCNSCHPSIQASDFSSYAGTKAKVDDGLFVLRVLNLKNMPLAGPLSQADRDKIQCWINNGAPNN